MSKPLKIDLHNHTVLCNHAEGKLHLYIEAAIAKGIDFYGVSDHAPMDFDPKYRMSFEQMKEYKTMVTSVQEKYKDKINVLFAYEVDYLPGHMDKRVLDADVDYLIGSAHFIDKWGLTILNLLVNMKAQILTLYGKNILILSKIWLKRDILI